MGFILFSPTYGPAEKRGDKKKIKELLALSELRDREYQQACEKSDSPACHAAEQKLRKAAADIIRSGYIAKGIRSSIEQQNTIAEADASLISIDRAKGVVQGYVGSMIDGIKGMAKGAEAAVLAATGDVNAQRELTQTKDALLKLADPDVLVNVLQHMDAAHREALANAYERGDGVAL
ncbi:DUF6862 domain-containing protein, partial [Chromobacterium vaccinii]|uniref:DUF6862 domain-containing protein n=1 Tax=Chromobacterium vaccinii TaxID=1108595 RepID=UPI00118512D0